VDTALLDNSYFVRLLKLCNTSFSYGSYWISQGTTSWPDNESGWSVSFTHHSFGQCIQNQSFSHLQSPCSSRFS